MTYARTLTLSCCLVLLASCAGTSGTGESAAEEQARITAERAALEAEFEAQRQREQGLLEDERQREIDARVTESRQLQEGARSVEEDAAAARARQQELVRQQEQAREQEHEQEREQQRQLAERSRQEAETQRQREAQRVEERAQAVARQQARIAELRERITANNSETTNLESANDRLREAITAAESLVATLSAEQEKYPDENSGIGVPSSPLSKSEIEALSQEVQRLRAQAAALSQQAP